MTLDEIQSLVDKGRKIFPVIFRGKEPSIPEFKEYANNENTDELLTDLFTRHSKQQGKMNFGMMTGADSGVLTIDLDYKHPDAEEFYQKWEEELKQGVMVRSGNGNHVHYKHPGPIVKTKIGAIDKGVDLLCDGGYVIIPDSIHPSGAPYEYTDFLTLADDLPDLPKKLHELIFDDSKWVGEGKKVDAPDDVKDFAKWIGENPQALFNTDPYDDEPIQEGGRNDGLCKVVGKILYTNLDNEDFDIDDLIQVGYERNLIKCNPPLENEEVERLCRSVYKTMLRKTKKERKTKVNLELGPMNAEGDDSTLTKKAGAAFGAGVLPEPEDKPSPREDPCGAALWVLHQDPFKPTGDSGTHNLIYLESNFYQRHDNVWKYVTEQAVSSNIQSFYEKATRTQVSNMVAFIKNYLYFPIKNLPFWKGGVAPQGYPDDPRKLIPFNNGLFDVEEYISTGDMQGSLKPHTDYLFNTVKMPYNLDVNAKCPQWLAFLDSIWGSRNSDRAEALKEWVGHMMIPDVTQQKIAILHGASRSGKSTIGKVLHKLIGHDNSAATNLHTMTNDHGTSALVGKTMAIMYDAHLPAKANGEKALEVLKSISGGDPQVINRKYHDPYTILLTTRIMMICNKIPRLNDSGNALINRLLSFKFTESFQDREDEKLEGKLTNELEGIAVWAIEGIREYVTRGRLKMPKEAIQEIQDLKRVLNPISAFVDDVLVYPTANGSEEISVIELYQAYIEWADSNYINYKLSKDRLLSEVKDICPNIRQVKRTGVMYWKGVKLQDDVKKNIAKDLF